MSVHDQRSELAGVTSREIAPEGVPDGEVDETPQRKRVYPAVIGVLLLFLGLWELLVRTEVLPPIIIPSPTETAAGGLSLVQQDFFFRHLWATVMSTLLGFGIGSALAFVLALILGYSSYLRRVFSVYIVMLQSVPKVAFAPVFIAWFGFGLVSKVVMSAVICFFPVFVDTLTGLGLTDAKAINLMRSLRATRTEILFKLRLPTALPNVFAGLKTGVTLALIGVIVAELVGTDLGLGFLIGLYSFQLQVDNVFAIIVMLGLIGWLLYAVVDAVNRRVVYWHRGSDLEAGTNF